MLTHTPSSHRKHSKGQILVILAIVFIGLVAIIGLAVDMGYLYVSYARLRRAVDAAALSATTQFKKNVLPITLDKAAREFLVLNGVPNNNSVAALVDTCTTTMADLTRWPDGNGDPTLCTDPPRKLVRVTANENVPLFFLAIVGINNIPIQVTSVSEAAAVDAVLVLDRSESMGILKNDKNPDGTRDPWPKPSINLDPDSCNSSHPDPADIPDGSSQGLWTGNCHPFQEVKAAAVSFVNEFMDTTYDRVAIVVFDNLPYAVNFGTSGSPVYLSNNQSDILDAIRHLWMYDGFHDSGGGVDSRTPTNFDPLSTKGQVCPYTQGQPVPSEIMPCRLFDTAAPDKFWYIDCAGYHTTIAGLPVPLNGTSCGSTNIGGGLRYASSIFGSEGRKEGALWVTILLTDGVPNAGYNDTSPFAPICPVSERGRVPFCRDTNALVRHDFNTDPGNYDTDDYARDQADNLASGSLIFSIGLGDQVTNDSFKDAGTPPAGSTLLDYVADKGGTTSYYQANPDDLQKIFLAIANRIATRLTQ